MPTFIEKCLEGEAVPDDIDDFIDQWHDNPEKESLRDFLGMTKLEYVYWMRDPSILVKIISSRSKGKSVDDLPK